VLIAKLYASRQVEHDGENFVRMLFTSMPVRSHITPVLALAITARGAGREVVFATGPDAVQYVEAAGLTAVTGGLPSAEIGARYAGRFPPDTLRELSPDQRLEHLVVHCRPLGH
jgi:hypothetical protein